MVVSHTIDGHRTPVALVDLDFPVLTFCPSLGPVPSASTQRAIAEIVARALERKRGRTRFLSQRFLRVR